MGFGGTVKFAKYLPNFGVEPIVLTAASDKSKLWDESFSADLAHHIERIPAQEPGGITARLAELFSFPDVYKNWIEPATKRAIEIAQKEKFDAVFSTASPYSSHVVGLQVSKQLGIPWVADFRDLWTTNAMYVARTPWQRPIHRRYERQFYERATHVLTASPSQRCCLLEQFNLPADKVTTITNGFDPADVSDMHNNIDKKIQGPIRITYLGSFYASYRPDDFVQALKLLLAAMPDLPQRLHFTFVGDHSRVAKDLLGQPVLQKVITLRDYVPHGELNNIHTNSDAYLCYLPDNGGWIGASIPQKLYEYLAAHKPILGIMPPSDATDILKRVQGGLVLPAGDIPAIAAGLIEFEKGVRSGNILSTRFDLTEFTRRTLAKKLADTLKKVVKVKQ